MPQSLVKNLIHLVYSTKHRNRWLHAEFRERLFAYQAGIFRAWESPALIIGGVDDHVHSLFLLSRNYPLKKIVEEVKTDTSKWLKTQDGGGIRDFSWQNGYAGFSVSESCRNDVRFYIKNQEEHHSKMSYQEELRLLFQKHGILCDERYVWD